MIVHVLASHAYAAVTVLGCMSVMFNVYPLQAFLLCPQKGSKSCNQKGKPWSETPGFHDGVNQMVKPLTHDFWLTCDHRNVRFAHQRSS